LTFLLRDVKGVCFLLDTVYLYTVAVYKLCNCSHSTCWAKIWTCSLLLWRRRTSQYNISSFWETLQWLSHSTSQVWTAIFLSLFTVLVQFMLSLDQCMYIVCLIYNFILFMLVLQLLFSFAVLFNFRFISSIGYYLLFSVIMFSVQAQIYCL